MKNRILFIFIAGILFSCNENQNPPKNQYGVDQLEAELISGNKDLGYEGCAVLVYPVDFKLPDGTTMTMKKEEEVRERLGEWYQNNPDTRQRAVMVFPVHMTFNGKSYTLNNEDEMRRVRKACNEKKRIFYEARREEVIQYLLDKGFDRAVIDAVVGVVVRALDEAKGQGQEYQISDRTKQYLTGDLGLSEDELETVQLLIVRLANS